MILIYLNVFSVQIHMKNTLIMKFSNALTDLFPQFLSH